MLVTGRKLTDLYCGRSVMRSWKRCSRRAMCIYSIIRRVSFGKSSSRNSRVVFKFSSVSEAIFRNKFARSCGHIHLIYIFFLTGMLGTSGVQIMLSTKMRSVFCITRWRTLIDSPHSNLLLRIVFRFWHACSRVVHPSVLLCRVYAPYL